MSDVVRKKLLIGLAEFYGEPMTATRLQMFAEVLSDVSERDLERAIQAVMRDPRVTRMPLPALLRQAVMPAANPEHEAIEASNRIVEALSKFGWCNAGDAKKFIGELGWLVVEREGGWEAVCEASAVSRMPTLKAQWRELAKALYGRSQRGEIDSPPRLPARVNETVMNLAARLSLVPPGKDGE